MRRYRRAVLLLALVPKTSRNRTPSRRKQIRVSVTPDPAHGSPVARHFRGLHLLRRHTDSLAQQAPSMTAHGFLAQLS